MLYREHEIFARVGGTYSDLYTLDDNGDLHESQDIVIKNGDEQVVWYEVEAIDPASGMTNMFTGIASIELAKKQVDTSIAWHKKNYPGDFE